MTFQWLQLRISEERDRRTREQRINERLPDALLELYEAVRSCIESYNAEFGSQASEAELVSGKVLVVSREPRDGKWQQCGKVEVTTVMDLPGFQVDRGGEPYLVEISVLPTGKLAYRDREADQYLTLDELSRQVLDRVLFPKLKQ
jgi:hypothetical protein